MELYKAKVLLQANHDHQVWKENLTAAELKLLEFIHAGQNPSVVEIEKTGKVNRTDRKERRRLLALYGEWKLGQGAGLIQQLFGVDGVPLPQVYEAPITEAQATVEDAEPEEDEEIISEPVVKAKARPQGRDPKTGHLRSMDQTEAESLAG